MTPKVLALAASLLLAGCSPALLQDSIAGAENLFGGDPASRECRARERQKAFDQGLNPAQALARLRERCG